MQYTSGGRLPLTSSPLCLPALAKGLDWPHEELRRVRAGGGAGGEKLTRSICQVEKSVQGKQSKRSSL